MRTLTSVLVCVLAGSARANEGPAGAAQISVRAENEGADGDLVPLVTLAAKQALPRVAQWGGLRVNTAVVILPNRDDLQARVHAEGDDWVDAWARYDTVYLVSPHTMRASGSAPSFDYLASLLAHELTHCTMQQAIGSRRGSVPFWFNEGMATVTSDEGSWYMPREEVATVLGRRPSLDPLHDRYLAHGEARLAYSVAYWSFTLLAGLGTASIERLLSTMGAGTTFADAFAKVYGEPLESFEGRLLRALRRGEPLR
ncbi:MAG: peptidase MA family metallohydrolase [Myxococcales bacterium]